MDRVIGMSSVVGGNTAQVEYSYTGDNLTTIAHNGFNYGLSYDAFVNVIGINVNGDSITSYISAVTRMVLMPPTYIVMTETAI